MLLDESVIATLMHSSIARDEPPCISFIVVLELSPLHCQIAGTDGTLSYCKHVSKCFSVTLLCAAFGEMAEHDFKLTIVKAVEQVPHSVGCKGED